MAMETGAGTPPLTNGGGKTIRSDAIERSPLLGINPGELGSEAINGLIEQEIIPRLLMTHTAPGLRSEFFEGRRIKKSEANKFADLPLTNEADFLLAEVESLRQSGVSTESIFVDLLATSARRLGKMWEDDECDFVEVTIGLWRLQEVMRDCAMRTMATAQPGCQPFTALFSPFPGEQHNFGALMIEEIFANAGWHTEVLLEPQRHELLHIVAERVLDVVGLTISRNHPSRSITELITAIRSVSKNSDIRVLIGGRFVNGDPSIAIKTGADGTAPDARSALALAHSLVADMERVSTAVD